MRCVCLAVVLTFCLSRIAVAEEGPRSLDPRVKIELFAEQPLIATPTGLDVDARGRVWAIECNTHFRPDNYPGHPSDRILVFTADETGKARPPVVFADGFTATMSVAVRPVWLPPVRLDGVEQGNDEALSRTTQVYVATRNQILLLEDADGDDVADRRTVLFELETKGNYPHNGFAGFAFDPLGSVFVGIGENLGEPYKVHDRGGAVVYQHDEGGHLYRFQPDGTGFRLWATGCWNPHASCFDAFGRMFSVDNDPDSRPPCRLLHIIEGGDYGYHFKNGRKGLHPFTSWNGELPGTLPMVAGTGEAPSAVLAYEHEALPEEYRGHLMATSWGDHRIDVFRLKPKGLSFESVAEPMIVGGENFRPVGLALAPDGSLYCTDWVLRDYKLHGKGRIWRISAVDGKSKTPDYSSIARLDKPGLLRQQLRSPVGLVRRTAARRFASLNSGQCVALVRDDKAPTRARFEALAAVVSTHDDNDVRVLKAYVPVAEAPFDPLQTLLGHFGESPSISRMQALLADPQGSDPMYVLGGMKAFIPVLRAVASTGSPKVVELLNKSVDVMDPFAFSALVRECARDLPPEALTKLVGSSSALSPKLRLAFVLAARRSDPVNEAAMTAALSHPETMVRRAAVQWAAEQRVKSLRPAIEKCLSGSPMDRDLFLSTIAALEMIEGKDPKDFDRTPAGKYVVPLLKDEKTSPAVLVEALRLVDPDDPVLSIERLHALLKHGNSLVQREALRTLAFRKNVDAIPLLIEQVMVFREQLDDSKTVGPNRSTPPNRSGPAGTRGMDSLLGLILHFDAHPDNERLRTTLLDLSRNSLAATSAFRGGRASDPATSEQLKKLYAEWGKVTVGGFATQPDVYEVHERSFLIFGEGQDGKDQLRPWTDRTPVNWRNEAMSGLNGPRDITPGHGRLVFFHPNGPGCSRCHTIDGRGGKVGPDLSKIGASFTVDKLIDSILEPSKEVSPQFTNWQMIHTDGRIFTGMIVHENEGQTILGDSDGKTIELKTAEIEERRPVKTSVMPEKLVDRMTVQEWRDLIAFLQSLK